jgi:hypothetical protein
VKIRCLECNKWFEPVAGERIHSAGCRHERRNRMARRSDKRHGARRALYMPRPEPVEMAVKLPFNPSDPFLSDADRRVCAEARA